MAQTIESMEDAVLMASEQGVGSLILAGDNRSFACWHKASLWRAILLRVTPLNAATVFCPS